mgnify:CR=1 FL=1
MLLLGMPLVSAGGWMWSIVQSLPASSLLQVTHTGSSILLAFALALRHSGLSCHSAIVVSLVGEGDAVVRPA